MSLLNKLDWNRVLKSYQDVNLATWDLEDLTTMLWAAGEKWLERDCRELEIVSVEERWTAGDATGITDLIGLRASDRVGVDWKTTNSQTLDAEWARRLQGSWQWRIYSWASNLDRFVYRGITRQGKTRELTLERPPDLDVTVPRFIQAVKQLRDSQANLDIWAENRPHGCGAYSRVCPYQETCPGNPKRLILGPLSYTAMMTLLLCPERYRREKADEKPVEPEETKLGTAFHRGIAEMYRQIQTLPC